MDIKKRIKEHGYTLAKLAEELGITQSALSQQLGNNPTISKLCDIAKVLGISVSQLVADDSEKDSSVITCPHCGGKINIKVD